MRACVIVALLPLFLACSDEVRGPVSGGVQRGEAFPPMPESERLIELTPADIVAIDLDGDADHDLLWHRRRDVPRIHWNDGDGAFRRWTELKALGKCEQIHLGDFDGDGLPDLFAISDDRTPLFVRDAGSAGFMLETPPPTGEIGYGIYFTAEWDDLPGDELLWTTDPPRALWSASFVGGEWMTRQVSRRWDFDAQNVVVADVGGDGLADFVLLETDLIVRRDQDGLLREEPIGIASARILAAGELASTPGCELLVEESSDVLAIFGWEEQAWKPLGRFPRYGIQAFPRIVDVDGDGLDDLVVEQVGMYDFGCYGGSPGWVGLSNWQVLLRTGQGWTLRETAPAVQAPQSSRLIAPLDGGPGADWLLDDPKIHCLRIVRDPIRSQAPVGG